MDSLSPVPNSSIPSVVNIDQMLGSLGQKTEQKPIDQLSVVQSNSTSSFNIDAITKPIPVSSPSLPGLLPQSTGRSFSSFLVIIKKIGFVCLACVFLLASYWFLSIQYPVESKEYLDKVLGFVSTTSTLVQNNISPSRSEDVAGSGLHAAADIVDIYQDTQTPLADSLDQAQTPDLIPTSTESTFDIALDATGSTSLSTGDILTDSGSALLTDNSMPNIESIPSDKKKLLRDDLILIKEKADTFIAQGSTTAVPLKLSIARAVSKKAEGLSSALEVTGADMVTIDTDTQQLQLLLQRLSK